MEYFVLFSRARKYFKKNNMKISYSNITKSYYLMNICQNCQAKQGEFFLFNEIDSIFSPNSVNEAKRLKIL